MFAVASTNHGRGRRGAETDDGGEGKSDGQPRGSNEAARRPGDGVLREERRVQCNAWHLTLFTSLRWLSCVSKGQFAYIGTGEVF